MSGGDDDGWMPRLADGVPIWKLSQDLNQPTLMDGCLLVPETEGSPSAPRVVRWHVRNLLPLDTAKATHPAELERALHAFREATARLALELENPASPYHAFRGAFSLPDFGNGHYFLDVVTCKLHVIHWGAEPRSHGAKGETVFGFGNLADLFVARTPGEAATPKVSPMLLGSTTAEKGPTTKSSRWWILLPLFLVGIMGASVLRYFMLASSISHAVPDAASPVGTTTVPTATVSAAPARIGRETLVPFDKPLYFEFGSARIDADGDATVKRAAAYLKAHPEIVRVRIEGHADAVGEDDKNFVLSTARALAVRRALVAAGVDGDTLSVDAHGQTKPTLLDAGAALQNRRVELWGFRYDAEGEGGK